ncbi:MAG: glycoside hydrolase [Gammaproteobacteria bacterium]|nr:glycoside hydrolase family 57 protein [Candidatus Thioaporhodococcus sediminis]TNF53055.1 MAG: glycoside hydrolase [Gammaproteobacteria bacterium]
MSAEPMPLDPARLPIVLCWHMHQPDYRGPGGHEYHLPWVYLHALKDYSDMAAHLEAQPQARAVVNFAPILLEQLEDYALQIRAWRTSGKRIRDPLLAALAGPGLPLEASRRRDLITACRKANKTHLIDRFPCLRELIDLADWFGRHYQADLYVNDQFLADLLVWYHLAWTGEHIRDNDPRVDSLQRKGRGFNQEDRRALVELIGEQLQTLIPRYRRLADEGRVELSCSPYAHPILPLLLDLGCAREALPDSPLPEFIAYPGGEERARWHLRRGLATFERHFGRRPAGCWPSEGALSEPTLRLLEEEGFRWVASGQRVLYHSLRAWHGEHLPEHWLNSPYRLRDGVIQCFFRDDGISDLIGFTYADWHAQDAVTNLVGHLERVADATLGRPHRVLSIIMDGENAWEYYPHNASFFLPELYRRLASHQRLQLTTFAELLAAQTSPPPALERLVAGSWVYGTLSTWIGHPDKNRAWDMLGAAKAAYDRALQGRSWSPEERERLELQLATCEGSDWFWWFGDDNPAEAVSDFERLYRQQLRQLYTLLGLPPPDDLTHPFTGRGGSAEHGGVMKRN